MKALWSAEAQDLGDPWRRPACECLDGDLLHTHCKKPPNKTLWQQGSEYEIACETAF